MKSLLLFLLLAGCTPLTEEQKYERDARYAEALDAFNEKVRQCRLQGGYIVVDRTRRNGYTTQEMSRAYCSRGF